MNKILTKIAAAFVGIAMAVGVGVASAQTENKLGSANAAAGDSASGSWEAISSTSDIVADTDYLLGYVYSGTDYFSKSTSLSSSALQTSSTVSEAKIVRFVSVEGGWNIQIASSTYLGYGSSSTNLATNSSGGTGAKYVWVATQHASGDIYFTTNNNGRFLGAASAGANANIKGYAVSNLASYPRVTAYKAAAAKTLSSIAITHAPDKTTYYVGDSFESAGMVVTATYSNSSTANVTSSCTFSPASFSSTGNQNVTVSYTEGGVTKTATQAVMVNAARTMQSISLHGTISKNTYYVGDSWDLTGLDIQVNWSEGNPTYVDLDDVSVAYECSPATATSTSITSFDLEVLYESFDETFTISGLTVNDHPLVDILNESVIGAQGATYTSNWSEISGITDYTGATYMMRTMKPSSSDYAMSTNANGYFVTTSCPSSAKVKSISFSFLTSGKNLAIYGSNTAYTAGTAPSATSVGTVNGTGGAVSFDFSELENSYKYVAFKGTGSSTVVGTISIEYESVLPTMEFTAGGTTANLHVVNGLTNSVTFNAVDFDSVSVGLFSNSPTNTNSTKANLSYSVSGAVVTVTATGKAVGDESFTISATGCSNTLTLNVAVQASTTFDSLVISTATTDVEFSEGDSFAVSGMVVTANFTVGGSPDTETFAESDGDHLLTALSFTIAGDPIEIGDPINTTGNSVTVGVSYTDGITGTTRSASYTIKVNAYVAHTYSKVTSAPADWRGTYLLGYEKEGTLYVLNSTLATLDATFNTVNTTEISGSAVTGSKEIDAAAVKIERNTISGTSYYHALCGNGKYLKSASKSINCQNSATAAVAVTFDDVSLKIGDYWLRFNTANDQLRFRFGDSSYLSSYTASLYKMDVTTAINAEVSNYVSGFDSSIGAVCDADGIDTDASALNTAWTAQATAFNALSVDAQAILANKTYSHDAESAGTIADIVDRYDYVYGKYSTSLTKGDFMNRTEAGTLVSYQ